MEQSANRARVAALHEIDKSERQFRMAFFSACCVELVLLFTMVAIANFHDRTQLLIFVGVVGSYTIIVLGLAALGAHVSRVSQRLMKAIEVADLARPER